MKLMCWLGLHNWEYGSLVGKGNITSSGTTIGRYYVYNKMCKCCKRRGFYRIEH